MQPALTSRLCQAPDPSQIQIGYTMLFIWPLPGSLQTLRTLAPAFQDRLLNICLTHQLQEVGPRETSMPGSGPLGRQRKRKALSCMCFFCLLQWSGTPAAAESSLLWKGKRFLCFPVNQNLQLLIRGSPNCSLCKNPVICGLVLDHCRESTGGFHPRVSGPTLPAVLRSAEQLLT